MVYTVLSYDVTPGCDIRPCIKIDLQILVTLCIEVHNYVVYIWQNLSVFTQKCDFKKVLWSYDK